MDKVLAKLERLTKPLVAVPLMLDDGRRKPELRTRKTPGAKAGENNFLLSPLSPLYASNVTGRLYTG